jgi:hypothetical protein
MSIFMTDFHAVSVFSMLGAIILSHLELLNLSSFSCNSLTIPPVHTVQPTFT